MFIMWWCYAKWLHIFLCFDFFYMASFIKTHDVALCKVLFRLRRFRLHSIKVTKNLPQNYPKKPCNASKYFQNLLFECLQRSAIKRNITVCHRILHGLKLWQVMNVILPCIVRLFHRNSLNFVLLPPPSQGTIIDNDI